MIHKIKAMYDEGKGLSMRAIARELGICRNTVRKYLSMEEEVIEARKSQGERSKVLDQHREYIVHLLQSYPGLSAVKIRDKLLRKHPGLSVSSRTVRRYVRRMKEGISIKQKRYYESVLDMEPGVQCQVDGGTTSLSIQEESEHLSHVLSPRNSFLFHIFLNDILLF